MTSTEAPAGIDPGPVTAWFVEHIDGVVAPLRFDRVAGGHSCLTYIAHDDAGHHYVVRRPPIGHVLATAHDVAREHKIISALADSDVPVAPALGLCTDVTVNDAAFYVMAFVDGLVLHNAADAEGLTPEGRRRAGEHLVDILVALHKVDIDAVGLGDLSKRTDYLGRQLRRWSSQWEGSKTKEVPGMERLQQWLVDNRPPDDVTRIVHGDFRLGNCIHAPDGTILAMLDWELCTLGDQMADVSYLLRSWAEAGDAPRAASEAPSRAEGFPSRDELVARYAAGTGRELDDLSYWMAFNAWRSSCIVQGVYSRYVDGKMAARGDEDIERFEQSVEEGMALGLLAAGIE